MNTTLTRQNESNRKWKTFVELCSVSDFVGSLTAIAESRLVDEKTDNKETAFLERMRFQIMGNLLLTVRNLHISYEMKSASKLGHPFSFGITLHYLELTVGLSSVSPTPSFRWDSSWYCAVGKSRQVNQTSEVQQTSGLQSQLNEPLSPSFIRDAISGQRDAIFVHLLDHQMSFQDRNAFRRSFGQHLCDHTLERRVGWYSF